MGHPTTGSGARKVLAFWLVAASAVAAECRVWTEATSGERGVGITVVVKATSTDPVAALVVVFKFDAEAFSFLERDFSESEAARNSQSCGGELDPVRGFVLARVMSSVPCPPDGLFSPGQDWELVRFRLRVRSGAVPGAHAAGIVKSVPESQDSTAFVDLLGQQIPAVIIRVRGTAGDMSSPWSSIVYTRLPGVSFFRRGDANADGRVDVADVIETCLVVHRGGRHIACEDAMDSNDDGKLNGPDVVVLLRYLFAMGAEPPSPGPRVRWFDPTADLLGCGEGTP